MYGTLGRQRGEVNRLITQGNNIFSVGVTNLVAGVCPHRLAGPHVKKANSAVSTAGGEVVNVGVECDASHIGAVTGEDAEGLGCMVACVEAGCPIGASRRYVVSIGRRPANTPLKQTKTTGYPCEML